MSLSIAGRVTVVLTLALLLCSPLLAQDVPIPSAPAQWVTDTAGFLPPADVERLNARLRDYEQQTQHQFIVWIGSTTGDVPIEDWANRAFEQWRVGRKGIDDGLALFIMAKDRRLRIEVGYGLEPQIPDLRASRIIEEIIVPRIRAGDNMGAVEAGLEALTQLTGQPLPGAAAGGDTAPVRESRPMTVGQLIFFGIVAVIVLGLIGTSPGLVIWMLISVLSGGNRRGRRGGGYWGGGGWGSGGGGWGGGGGGWGGGGGGFSGGGGMSGGGGASGSW